MGYEPRAKIRTCPPARLPICPTARPPPPCLPWIPDGIPVSVATTNQGQAIAHGQNAESHAIILVELAVQGPNGLGVSVIDVGIDDLPLP